ncbi:hypothetical protein VTI74DRAFT_11029 [Chaetomium olivicolor]
MRMYDPFVACRPRGSQDRRTVAAGAVIDIKAVRKKLCFLLAGSDGTTSTLVTGQTPDRMSWTFTCRGQELIPTSISGLSLQSASSGSSWHSPSSTSSRKRSLEPNLEDSPFPKWRLGAEMTAATTLFWYSAPCLQSSFDPKGERRRSGFLGRSGALIRDFMSTQLNHIGLLHISSCFGPEWPKKGK